jgi:hypothetical protein
VVELQSDSTITKAILRLSRIQIELARPNSDG